MSQVLVISGHPDLKSSHTNTVILDELSSRVSDIEVRDLGALYPDYQIDVEAEQAALVNADLVVLQFPFYWYSVPALLKKWIDDVFSYDFAYGAKGDKLKGKDLVLSFTVGGPQTSYDPLGYNHFTIEQLILPIQQTAYLAGMVFHKPVYTHQMVYIPGVYNKLEDVQGRARDHADRLIGQIDDITDSPEQKIKKFATKWFADFDLLPEDPAPFLPHVGDNMKLVMVEGEFLGKAGFLDWYAGARQTFKPHCQHIIEQIEVAESEDGHTAALRVRLIADTYEDSALAGQSVNLLVNEQWHLSIGDDGHITIDEYLVEVLS